MPPELNRGSPSGLLFLVFAMGGMPLAICIRHAGQRKQEQRKTYPINQSSGAGVRGDVENPAAGSPGSISDN